MVLSAFQLCNGSAMLTSLIIRSSYTSFVFRRIGLDGWPSFFFIFNPGFLFSQRNKFQPHKRLYTFFCSLYAALSRGSRAVFQFYPENSMQVLFPTGCSVCIRICAIVSVLHREPNAGRWKFLWQPSLGRDDHNSKYEGWIHRGPCCWLSKFIKGLF